jgi:hypothetical protein
VGSAFGVLNKPRVEWDAVDLRYGNKTIEVKCSAYLQSWKNDPSSIVIFDIWKNIAWLPSLIYLKKNRQDRPIVMYFACLKN